MEKNKVIISILVICIAVLSGFACIKGIESGLKQDTFTYLTIRGESVEYQSEGIYQYNPRGFVAEGLGWDVVTLIFGIPALLVSLIFFNRGSFRGGIVLSGILAYFFYQYLLYVTGWAYNNLFLIYTFLYSVSAITVILVVKSIGINNLAGSIKEKSPRISLAVFMFFIAGFLSFMWLGQIVPSLIQGQPPAMLKGLYTLVVQAFDLGILVPFAVFSGIFLLKRNAWGYVMASVGIVKLCMMALAIIAMVSVRSVVEQQPYVGEIVIFSVFALVGGTFLFILLRGISEEKSQKAKI